MATETITQTTTPPVSQQSKKRSKSNKQAIVQGLNQLHAPKDFDTDPKCVDIIAVPGLGSDMTYTWMWEGKIHWLRDGTMLPSVIPKARISVYGYRSQWFGPDAVEIRLSVIGRDLLEAIKVDRRESKNKKRPIIFIGHSLGGLVVTKAVTAAKRESEDFKGIIDCITACVFLGTPFRGSEAQPWAKIIGLAGNVLGQAKYSSLIRTLKSGSTELDDLADEFLHDVGKTQIDVECYYELEKTKGMVIADMKSSTFEGKPRHPWSRTHSEMNKFEGPKDNNYKQISGALKDMANQSFKKIKLREDALKQEIVNDSRVDKILEALEVNNPKKDLDTICRINGISKGTTLSSWIQKDERYLAWKNDPSSQNIWICGSPGKGKTMAAIAMVQELSKLGEQDTDSYLLGHFFCDEQDKDKSKAINVLKSLAWQLLRAKRYLVRHFFGEDSASKNAGQKTGSNPSSNTGAEYEFDSLPDLWKSLKAALNDPTLGTVYLLVNGLDQIDSESRKQLLNLITSFRPVVPDDEDNPSGPFVKWFFLSVQRDDIFEVLQEAKILNLDDASNSAGQEDDLRVYVSQKVSEIAKERQYSRSLEYFVKGFICLRARGKSNYDWVNLVCLELDNNELPNTAVRQRLENLPTDLYPMYDQVSHRVLGASDIQVEYSKDILRCLLLVHYPPTLQELAVVAGLPEEERENRKALKTHVQRCGALTKMFKDGQDIKVQLSHISVREFLKSKANDWLCMGSEQIQHGVIALRCFEFVLSLGKADEKDEVENDEVEKDEAEKGEAEKAESENGGVENGEVENGEVEKDEPEHTDDNEDKYTIKTTDGPDIDSSDDDFSEFESDDEWDDESEPDAKQQTGVKDTFKYAVTQWIEHALEATADIVENFGIEDVFWVLGSKERAEWSKSYSQLNPDLDSDGLGFDVDFTALHVAAYFGYMPLADLLLKSGQHDEEIQTTDSGGFQPLYWACRRGHMNMVQKLCEASADVNYQQFPESHPLTALHGAVKSGNSEITAYLLNHHAEINAPNETYGSPLYVAAENGYHAIVQQLLVRKADANLHGGIEVTALNAAVCNGDLEIVKLLVGNGAELNPSVEYEDGNALGAACSYGHAEIAEYLLQQGCDFTKKDSEGSSPLEAAAEGGYADIVKLLLQYDKDPESHERALVKAAENGEVDVVLVLVAECPTIKRSDAFYSAASSGYTGVVKALTNAGVEPDVLEKSLYEAVDYQYDETVEVLLDMGIDPNAEGEEFGNAVQASAFDGTTRILEMLLDKGANPDRVYTTSGYGTALQAACYEGTLENVQMLLDRGASVNPEVSGVYGTPLQAACAQGQTEIVELLLGRGANPNTEGGMYGYAIIAATDVGYAEILDLLVEHKAAVNVTGPDGSTPLTNAAMELPKPSLELLISHGALIHVRDGDNDTALTNAAAAGDEESVRYLLEQGLDVQAIGKWGGALYRATKYKFINCMNILLEYHVNVNQEGGTLHTPLQVAAHAGDVELVNLLLEHGADVDIAGGKYHTALQAAVAADSLEIAQLLVNHNAEPNENGGEYGSALHAAMYADDPTEFIDLLLEHGADLNSLHERGTPLQLAAAVSTSDVVAHLLEKEADPNIVAGKYGTALQAACSMNEPETVEELLENEADPFLRGGFFGNAFVAAAANGMEEYVQQWLLKDPPSEVLVEALHYAVHFREKDVVSILLDHGVDINVKSSLYSSAMIALESEITSTERTLMEGDLDFWYADDEEDDEDDDEEDGGDSDGNGDGDYDDDDIARNRKTRKDETATDDDDDNSGNGEDDDGVDEHDKEAEAEAEKEIKEMLQKLLENTYHGNEWHGESDQPRGSDNAPFSSEKIHPILTTRTIQRKPVSATVKPVVESPGGSTLSPHHLRAGAQRDVDADSDHRVDSNSSGDGDSNHKVDSDSDGGGDGESNHKVDSDSNGDGDGDGNSDGYSANYGGSYGESYRGARSYTNNSTSEGGLPDLDETVDKIKQGIKKRWKKLF